MQSKRWTWGADLKLKGEDGFNNAGILTFNSHVINSLVRELFQNSNDAKNEKSDCVKIKIEQKNISKSNIPAFEEYLSIINLVETSHPNQKKFFLKAKEILRRDKIPFLIYSDYNTTGLTGSENESYSSFMACVLSEGISAEKGKNAGGSYGIGKNAIYGVSLLRTVFYSSVDTNNNPIFQGVAKLASYKKNNQNHEGRIYLGLGDERLSVRNRDIIPELFRRDGSGLSQYVMGVELDENWEISFTKAILRNYWKLLLEKKLEVEIIKDGVLKVIITKNTVASLLEQMYQDDEEGAELAPYGNPKYFYDAFLNGTNIEFEIKHLGKCRFYFKESENGENNIAYLRNGMVVYSKIEKRLVGAKITGVFQCETDHGNEILRKLEPPKHDSFEPQMLEDNHLELGKKDGEKILAEIKAKIREVIKALIDKYKEETETPEFLVELFEDLQKNLISGSRGNRTNEASDKETIYKRGKNEEIEVELLSDANNTYITNSKGVQLEPGGGNQDGTGSGKKANKSKGGNKSSGGGSARGNKTPKLPIKSRVYHHKAHEGINQYKCVIITDEELGLVELNLSQYADSGEDVAFKLVNAYENLSSPIQFTESSDGYKLQVNLNKGRNTIYFDIADSQKSAFVLNG